MGFLPDYEGLSRRYVKRVGKISAAIEGFMVVLVVPRFRVRDECGGGTICSLRLPIRKAFALLG